MPGRPPKFTAGGAVYNDDVTIATVTGGAGAGGTTAWTSASDWAVLRLNLRGVSFTGGTAPNVTVTVQQAADASGTGLSTLGTFPAATAGQISRLLLGPVDRFVRCSWAGGGTATPTTVSFTVDGEGV
jgi:hypothetical protein